MAGELTPAAHCTVHITVGNDQNTELDISADSLAPPSSLTPPRNVYVVWLQPPGKNPQNHGQLAVDKNEKAELKTETPFKRFKVFITAEDQAQLSLPEGPTVLSADVTAKK